MDQAIVNFINDVGPRPGRGWTIERIDVHGDYTPDNCRWEPPGPGQNRNQTQTVLNMDRAGEIRKRYADGCITITQLANEYGYKSWVSIKDIIENKIWKEDKDL